VQDVADRSALVSVVILNYQGKEFLSFCVASVLRSSYRRLEVVIVDNGSRDGSIELAEGLFGKDPRVKIVKLKGNVGFAAGNNAGVKYCTGKYVVFLNNDTVVDRMWITELVKVMEKRPDAGALQSKLLRLSNPKIFDSTGDFVDYFGLSFCRASGEEDRGQYNHLDEIFSARAAAMMVRSSTLKDVGVFDDSFFMIFEDIDLGWRIRLRGYKVLYVPSSVVYHYGEATTRRVDYGIRIFHGTKNLIAMVLKNKCLSELLKFNPLPYTFGTVVSDIVRKRDARILLARLRAILWVLRRFPELWKRRLTVQNFIRNTEEADVRKLMLKTNLTLLAQLFVSSLKFGENIAWRKYFARIYRSQRVISSEQPR